MGWNDTLNYIIFTNPVSSSITSGASSAFSLTKQTLGAMVPTKRIEVPVIQTIVRDNVPLWRLAQEGGPFIRIAGLMGASAVVLGAYGAHKSYPKEKGVDLQRIFETGNRYHFLNTLGLFGVPMCRYPKVSGTLLITGICLFSGACYYHAITGENKFRKLAPIGGTCLILGWLAMVL